MTEIMTGIDLDYFCFYEKEQCCNVSGIVVVVMYKNLVMFGPLNMYAGRWIKAIPSTPSYTPCYYPRRRIEKKKKSQKIWQLERYKYIKKTSIFFLFFQI